MEGRIKGPPTSSLKDGSMLECWEVCQREIVRTEEDEVFEGFDGVSKSVCALRREHGRSGHLWRLVLSECHVLTKIFFYDGTGNP